MLADFRATLEREGPWAYRRLHWEAGLTGQCLHLEAVAAGLSGSGIGCFFDESLPDLLGFDAAAAWRVLYAFAIGGALPDTRHRTHPACALLTVRDLEG